jgi:hypothetical protein
MPSRPSRQAARKIVGPSSSTCSTRARPRCASEAGKSEPRPLGGGSRGSGSPASGVRGGRGKASDGAECRPATETRHCTLGHCTLSQLPAGKRPPARCQARRRSAASAASRNRRWRHRRNGALPPYLTRNDDADRTAPRRKHKAPPGQAGPWGCVASVEYASESRDSSCVSAPYDTYATDRCLIAGRMPARRLSSRQPSPRGTNAASPC